MDCDCRRCCYGTSHRGSCSPLDQRVWIPKVRTKPPWYNGNCQVSDIPRSNWKWPDIPGLTSFGGELVHSANWKSDVDFTGKTIALIGNGSTGIQLLPEIQRGPYSDTPPSLIFLPDMDCQMPNTPRPSSGVRLGLLLHSHSLTLVQTVPISSVRRSNSPAEIIISLHLDRYV